MKFPNFTEEQDNRKKLTVRWMVKCLIDRGMTYREMAEIFDVSYSLFGKLKIQIKTANSKRYIYKSYSGNTKEYRERKRKISGDKLLNYERYHHKKSNDKKRKNNFTPRLSKRKFNPP